MSLQETSSAYFTKPAGSGAENPLCDRFWLNSVLHKVKLPSLPALWTKQKAFELLVHQKIILSKISLRDKSKSKKKKKSEKFLPMVIPN